MKKILALLLAAMLLVPVFATAEDMPVLKIGVFEPASGDSGAGGKQETLGVQYANTVAPTVEIGGTTYKVELVLADNGSSPDKAPSAAQKLVSEGVSVALGTYGSSVAIAGSPVFKDANIPVIGLTCTNVDPDKIDKDKFYLLKGKLEAMDDENGDRTVILRTESIEETEDPEDEYVNFN